MLLLLLLLFRRVLPMLELRRRLVQLLPALRIVLPLLVKMLLVRGVRLHLLVWTRIRHHGREDVTLLVMPSRSALRPSGTFVNLFLCTISLSDATSTCEHPTAAKAFLQMDRQNPPH